MKVEHAVLKITEQKANTMSAWMGFYVPHHSTPKELTVQKAETV